MNWIFQNFDIIGFGLMSYLFFCEKKHREHLRIKHDLGQVNNKIKNGNRFIITSQEEQSANKLLIERDKPCSEIKVPESWPKLNLFKRCYS